VYIYIAKSTVYIYMYLHSRICKYAGSPYLTLAQCQWLRQDVKGNDQDGDHFFAYPGICFRAKTRSWQWLSEVARLVFFFWNMCSGWWFGTFFIFPNSWDDDPIWPIFSGGWNHQLVLLFNHTKGMIGWDDQVGQHIFGIVGLAQNDQPPKWSGS